MKKIIPLFLLLTATTVLKSQEKFRTAIENFGTIDFPVQPTMRDTLGQKIYFVKDSAVFFMVCIQSQHGIRFKTSNREELDNSYKDYMRGVMQPLGAGTIVQEAACEVQTYRGRDYTVDYTQSGQAYPMRYFRFFYVNETFVSIWVWITPGSDDRVVVAKDTFIRSLRFKEGLTQKPPGILSALDPHAMGALTAKLLILGGIIYAAIYFTRNRNKNQTGGGFNPPQ